MSMRYRVDPDACVCSGFCVQVSEDYFQIKGPIAVAMLDEVDPQDEDLLREAEALCPSGAIEVDE